MALTEAENDRFQTALQGVAGRMAELLERTEGVWMNAAGTHEVRCLDCDRQAIGDREHPPAINHADGCVVVAYRALVASRADGSEEE